MMNMIMKIKLTMQVLKLVDNCYLNYNQFYYHPKAIAKLNSNTNIYTNSNTLIVILYT